MIRWLGRLVEPGGWLLLIAWGVQEVEVARVLAAPYARVFCFAALAAAGLLGWFFNRSRVLFAAVVVALTVWGVAQMTAAGEVFRLARLAAIFLLPLNFIFFEALEERGVLTPSGIFKVGIILAQALGVLVLGGMEGGRLEAVLRWREQSGSWTWMPLTEQLSFAAAALALLVFLFLRRSKIEHGLLWALIASFVALNKIENSAELFIYSGAAGVILLVSLLEHSYNVAYLDELTGLPSRRSLNERLVQLGSHYAIAMCDIDHFKQFNDTYGHETGDQVLRMVASNLSRVRGGGRAYRYGGEEFTVVFPGYDAEKAAALLEMLRTGIEHSGFTLRALDRPKEKPRDSSREAPEEKPDKREKKVVSVTISIGVAERSEDLPNPELVIEAADAALYQAKDAGRNCVKIAGD